MRYIRRTSHDIKENFLRKLLLDRKTINEDEEFCNKFFYPTRENLLDPLLLDNMEEGFQMFKKHLESGSKFLICVDSDMDGITSAATLYNYMMDNLKQIYPNFTIDYHIPEGKEHGLELVINDLLQEKNYDIVILPDSSSNDYEYHEQLKEAGYDILVLDHHEAEKYSENAIVINNQLSENYENKALSGVGVVYKFLQYCDIQFGLNKADDYLDLVAMGQCGDMMDLNTPENRYICSIGFKNFNNFGIREFLKHQSYSIFGQSNISDTVLDSLEVTPIQVAFYIAPLINALIRIGTQREKELLFQSFIIGDKQIESTKRGHKGEMETIAEQSARNCTNARTRQNKYKEKAIELLDIQISNDCLDDNKILILNVDELDVPTTITGLCAMGVAAKYKKPVLLGRADSEGNLKGSGRNCNGSEFKDFKQFLSDSGLMNFTEGHASAFGHSIKISNIDKLYNYANEKLKDINFNEGFYEADFIVNGNCSYLEKLIFDLDNGKSIYGQNCPEPVIIIENVIVDSFQVMGANKDTVKITFNGISYIKFKAKDLIEELEQYKGKKISLTIAGRGNVNEWCGKRSGQIFIDEIEINEVNNDNF